MREFRLAYSSIWQQTPDLNSFLTTVAAAGWEGWEIRQPLDWLGSAKRVRDISLRTGVAPAIVTARSISLDGDYAMMEMNKRRIEFAAEVGADCYMFMGAQALTADEDPKDRIRALAELGEKLAEYGESLGGLEVCYHIHTNTTVDSVEEWRMLMELLHKCRLCIDVSHSALWGWDPSDAIRTYQDRLIYIHLQEWKSYQYVELGQGDLIDYPQVLRTLEEIGFRRWVTVVPGRSRLSEKDKMRVNREYLRSLGY